MVVVASQQPVFTTTATFYPERGRPRPPLRATAAPSCGPGRKNGSARGRTKEWHQTGGQNARYPDPKLLPLHETGASPPPFACFQAIQKIGTISAIRGSSGNFGFNNLLEGY